MAFVYNGYSTLLSFPNPPGVFRGFLVIETLTPIGLDGGGMIDLTSMENVAWRTRLPKALMTATDLVFTAQYDPIILSVGQSFINYNQLIDLLFPDGSVVEFWGWLNELKPGENKEGELPLISGTFIPSNVDAGTGLEAGPVYFP